jgi:hypothetical protein
MLLANTAYLDDLFANNFTVFDVPVQNYFGSNHTCNIVNAQMKGTTIKYDFPVTATADRKPYRLVYTEFDSQGAGMPPLRIGSIYGCSNAQDIKNPTAECVQYDFTTPVQYVYSSVNLVKTITNGLVYLSPLLP